MPGISLPDGCVERFVVDVKQPAAVRGAGRDRTPVSALDEAPLIEAWNTRLALTGVILDEVENGTCLGTDEYCIVVDTIAQCPEQPLACGCADVGDPVNGVYTNASKIWIRNTTGNSYTWNDDTRQYTLGHEFGHLFGLANSSCPAGSTIMTAPASCGQPLGDDAKTPQPSDGVPVTKAVHGNAPRKTCGW